MINSNISNYSHSLNTVIFPQDFVVFPNHDPNQDQASNYYKKKDENNGETIGNLESIL